MQLADWFYALLRAARKASVRLLRVGAIVRRKVASRDSQAEDWAETLGQVIADLDLLSRDTEQDFLKVGGKLLEFIETVNLISSELTALADLLSEEHWLRVSQALTSALDLSVEMRAHYADHNGGLDRVRQEARRLTQTLAGFQGIVATFHTLGVLTRIETARLGAAGADFGNLADDVKLLAGNVQSGVESALDSAARLETAMHNISAIEEGQAKDVPAVISGVLASISSFRDMQNRAHDSSVRLRAQYDAISDAFKELIVSIQFHDITRQQVEHVIEVLRRLRSESEAENGSIGRDQRGIGAVLALQSSQLADAGGKFAASVASVTRHLDDIATHVLKMADESRTLSGFSEDEQNSFFLQMEQGCGTILATLSHCTNATNAEVTTRATMAETIGRMRGSIEEIRAIEIQMERMALNASIRAAHIGVSGDALSVLASSMQQRAFESRQRSESLVEELGSMSEAATRFSGRDGPAPASKRGSPDGCLEEIRIAGAELHSSSERSSAQIAQIIARAACLCEELSGTRKSFSVGTLFAEAVSRARGTLKEIGEKTQSALSRNGTEAAERGLADLTSHYTMQSERDVHESVTKAVAGAAPVAVPSGQPESTPEKAGELGENVEFF